MIVGLDTSVVVRLLTRDPPQLAARALDFFTDCQQAGRILRVSGLVLAESYYALQYHYGVPKARALESLRDFATTPGVEAPAVCRKVLEQIGLASSKPGFVDRIILGEYLAAGAREVVTFEQAARRLPQARVL